MKKLVFLFFLICGFFAKASDFYWVGGTGNWSDYGNHWATMSGGVIFHTSVPGPLDDVFFDANSFLSPGDTVNIDIITASCRNLDFSGSTNGPLFTGPQFTSEVNIYGSLALVPGLTIQIAKLNFQSPSAGNTILTAGILLWPDIRFIGGGEWILSDSLSANDIFLNYGTLNTNGNTLNCVSFHASGNQSTELQTGSSIINVAGRCDLSSTSLTVIPGSSVINCNELYSGTSHAFNDVFVTLIFGSNCTYNNVILHDISLIMSTGNYFQSATFNGKSEITGSNSYGDLIFNNPGGVVKITGTQTVSNSIIANGNCTGFISIISRVEGTQAVLTKTSGTVNVDYVVLKDIAASGGAVFNANNSADAGNVSGWNIISGSGTDFYWISGTGNWGDVSHWSLASGGTAGSCIPGPFDNVFFDLNSFIGTGDTVLLDGMFLHCKNMDWTGATGGPNLRGQTTSDELNVFGSLTLANGMQVVEKLIRFCSAVPGNLITTSGVPVFSDFVFSGNGSWMLTDSLNLNSFRIYQGTFNSNNQNIKFGDYFVVEGTNPISLQLGTSWIQGANVDFNSQNVTIALSQFTFSAGNHFEGGKNHTFHDVYAFQLNADSCIFHDITTNVFFVSNSDINNAVFNYPGHLYGSGNHIQSADFTSNGIIDDDNEFDTLNFNLPGAVLLISGTQTINDFLNLNGACNGFVMMQSQTQGTQASIVKSSGTVTANNVVFKDIDASGGATFTALNSVDAGNVSGWTITSPPPADLFWVGGSGNWEDVNHWSISSGGPGGSCIPGPANNVIFDSASFTGINDTVYVNTQTLFCNNMDWTAVTNSPYLYCTSTANEIWIFGSLLFSPAMTCRIYNILFCSDLSGNIIRSAGIHLGPEVMFNGDGDWTLDDPIACNLLNFKKGTFYSNNFDIKASTMYANSPQPVSLYLGTSFIDAGGDCNFTSTSLTLDADSSVINSGQLFGGVNHNFNMVSAISVTGNTCTFNEVNGYHMFGMQNCNIKRFILNGDLNSTMDNNIIQYAMVLGSSSISGDNTFDTLIFNNPGQSVKLDGIQTINTTCYTAATAGFPISIESKTAGVPCTLNSPPGNNICLDYLYMKDITSTGGASFFAGDHSVDLGNNSGWTWSSCTPDTSNVWPGDANYDLTADNIDILYIGLAYGYTGPVRTGATTNWVAQPGIDWLQQFATGYNIKHADCDGNGLVDATDTNAVVLNYGQVHPFKQPPSPTITSFGTPLYFDLPPGALVPGSTVDIPIMFGTVNEPADKFYGVAFTVNYDPSLIQPGSVEIIFNNTWFGNGTNTIHLNKDFYNNGNIDMAFTKTDHTDEAGYGQFATLHFVLNNNASGPLNLSFSKILVMDKYEIPQPVNVTNGSVSTGTDEIGGAPQFNLYPNPANDILNVSIPGKIVQEISLIDALGRIVRSVSASEVHTLNLQGLSAGTYLVEVITRESVLRKKILITR